MLLLFPRREKRSAGPISERPVTLGDGSDERPSRRRSSEPSQPRLKRFGEWSTLVFALNDVLGMALAVRTPSLILGMATADPRDPVARLAVGSHDACGDGQAAVTEPCDGHVLHLTPRRPQRQVRLGPLAA